MYNFDENNELRNEKRKNPGENIKLMLIDSDLFPNVSFDVFNGIYEAVEKSEIELVVGFEALVFLNNHQINLTSREIISIIKNISYRSYNFGLNKIGEELMATDRLRSNGNFPFVDKIFYSKVIKSYVIGTRDAKVAFDYLDLMNDIGRNVG